MYFVVITCENKEQTGEEGQKYWKYCYTKIKYSNAEMPQTISNSWSNYCRAWDVSQIVLQCIFYLFERARGREEERERNINVRDKS